MNMSKIHDINLRLNWLNGIIFVDFVDYSGLDIYIKGSVHGISAISGWIKYHEPIRK